MKAVISIHDVCPYFRREIEVILKELEHVKKSFLITLLWHEDRSSNTDFFTMLGGEDVVVHGLTHEASKSDYLGKLLLMSNVSLKEFHGLDEAETRTKIERAKNIFEDIYGRRPTGFIPPMWYNNDHSINILKDLGFTYTESQTSFIDLRNDATTFSIPVCFDFGNNKLLSYVSLYGWKYIFKHFRQSLIRFSIHPSDVKNGFLPDIVKTINWLQSNNYSFFQYGELMKQ
jgi:predicted deacetylase